MLVNNFILTIQLTEVRHCGKEETENGKEKFRTTYIYTECVKQPIDYPNCKGGEIRSTGIPCK
ncbi:hypothetical protein IscW_ISCW014497 [Ixodes scapularis]|uniref:Uncharacterized protein n=1 Tax=Ixodes scapularis TaxID=6945 RepID=B7QHQ2_IXOSC|nr:hypothetical protein IscW_ISCW014497 [Ixodes scapularis]|eukprot:XP_002414709.1 hypothetical protein IscW_ISCW014497 [Ixodes scapularis]